MKKILTILFLFLSTFAFADLSQKQQKEALVSFLLNDNRSSYFGGSGFFIAPNYILTCSHLTESKFKNKGELFLFIDGQYYPLVKIYNDRGKDIAIYRSDYYHSKTFLDISNDINDSSVGTPIASYGDFTNSGEKVYESHGNILGTSSSFQLTGTSVVIPGFSGGPVINRKNNKVIGIVQRRQLPYNHVIFLNQVEINKVIKGLNLIN